MAGAVTIPSLDFERRRRFHLSSKASSESSPSMSACGLTRQPSSSSPSSLQGNNPNQTDENESLGLEAKMAKERLDKRLRPHLKSQTNREIRLQKSLVIRWQETIFGRRRFSLIWMKRKTSEQEKCSVCLEELSNGRSLDLLPCGHKFHSYCLRPWLPKNPPCPNCRTSTIP